MQTNPTATPVAATGETTYSAETHKTVIADLCAGKSMAEAAKAHKVDLTTVALWSRESQSLIDSMRADHLKDAMVLYTLKAFQAGNAVLDDVISDPKFRKAQSATGLMGIISGSMDKSLMLLAAMNRGPGTAPQGTVSPASPPPVELPQIEQAEN